MVRCWRRHKQWITNVHMQRGGFRELISGSRNGEVKLWDIRKDEPIREITATSDTMRTLSVHEHAPVFATRVSPNLLLHPTYANPESVKQRLRDPRAHPLQRQRRKHQYRPPLHSFPHIRKDQPNRLHIIPPPSDDARGGQSRTRTRQYLHLRRQGRWT